MIKTKYGNASINNGYYNIRSNEHGFRGQNLHRLITKGLEWVVFQ